MADNLTTTTTVSTIPSGSVIATDDAGAGGHVQLVKLAVSTDGSATALTADNTNGLLVNLGANNDVTLATLPDTAAGDLAAINTAVSGTLTVGSHAVTNAGTFVIQEDGAALTALQLIDDAIYTDDVPFTAGSNAIMAAGFRFDDVAVDGVTEGDIGYARMSSNRNLYVQLRDAAGNERGANVTAANELNVISTAQPGVDIGDVTINNASLAVTSAAALDVSAATVPTNWNGTAPPIGAGLEATALRVTLATDSTGLVSVDDNGGALTVDWNGTAPPIGAGVEATALRVTVATDSTGVLSIDDNGGAITVDNGGTFVIQENGAALTALQLIDDAIYVDDADWTADTSKHALVGAVTQATPTANTDGDTTPLITNALRELRTAALESDLAAAGTAHVHKYFTGATPTDGIIWSPAAGKRWYVTHLSINVSAASTVTIEDDKAGGDDPVYKAEFAANSGVVLTFPDVPLFSGEDAADLTVTASAGTVYVTAVGYEI